MSRESLILRAKLAATAIGIAVIAAGTAATAFEPSPEMKKVIAAAKKEGKLTLQFSPSLLGNIESVKAIHAGANKLFGTNLDLQFTPDPGSIPRNLNKIFVSQQAGKPAPSSIFIGTGMFMNMILQRNGVQKVPWVKLMPQRIDDRFTEGSEYFVRVWTTLPGGIIYNTQRAPMKPKAIADLLRPEWKGKVATTPYAANFDIIASDDFWGKDRALDFTRKFAKQVSGLIGCPDLERVASGEFYAFAMDCAGRDWVKLKRKGAPIDFVIPRDLTAQRFYYMSVTKNAPNPNAAKLFVSYFLTREGQKILWDADDTDLHMFPDSGMKEVVADYVKRGIKFKQITIAWERNNLKVNRGARQRAIKIIRSR